MSIYLDYNASTPIDPRVLSYMNEIFLHHYGNADSRTHNHGIDARKIVEDARKKVASLLETSPHDIFFTGGATESDNMAISGLKEFGEQQGKKHIVSSAIEHKAILEPLKKMQLFGFEVDLVPPDRSGRIHAEDIIKRIRDDTLLVSVMHANNETGIVQPVLEIGRFLEKTDVIFHIDAAQTCGKIVQELREIDYDLLSITGHKMYGPQGIGALVSRKRSKSILKPILFGGGHEKGMRPGTLAVALIAALGETSRILEVEHSDNMQQYRANKEMIISGLESHGIKYCINGDEQHCLPNTLNISFLGIDSEALMIGTKKYWSVSNGSACTSNNYAHSHVLKAMGLSNERIESAIRISWGKELLSNDSINPVFEWMKNMQ